MASVEIPELQYFKQTEWTTACCVNQAHTPITEWEVRRIVSHDLVCSGQHGSLANTDVYRILLSFDFIHNLRFGIDTQLASFARSST